MECISYFQDAQESGTSLFECKAFDIKIIFTLKNKKSRKMQNNFQFIE